MSPAGHFSVRLDHPSLPGHFPGRPVVPGVVLLDELLALILLPGTSLKAIETVKFVAAVLPGERIDVLHAQTGVNRVEFAAFRATTEVLRGRLTLCS